MSDQILEWVPVHLIIEHWELNRTRNDLHVDALARHIDADGYNEKYPLSVVKIGGDFHLGAGHHRLAAAKTNDLIYPNLPIEKVPAVVIEGDIDDVVRLIHEDNFKHDPALNSGFGMPLTQAEKIEQCRQLLQFPDYFEQSDARLQPIFGVHSSTISRWRKKLQGHLQTCARKLDSAEMSAETLFVDFGLTPERLEKLIALIKSGKRIGKDGRLIVTHASADKKEQARLQAIENFQASLRAVCDALSAIYIECPLLKKEYVKRRLYAKFDLQDSVDVDMWDTPTLAKQQEAISQLRSELEDRDASRWCEEFRRFDKVKSARAELQKLSKPFLTSGVESICDEVNALVSDDFEGLKQAERLDKLSKLAREVNAVLQIEQAARADNLPGARDAAAVATGRLVKDFRAVALSPDADGTSYRDFVSAALQIPKASADGYSDKLTVDQFLKPSAIDIAGRAWAVQSIAKRMRGHLTSDEQPTWMHRFLKSPAVQTTDTDTGTGDSAVTREPNAPVHKSGNEKHDEPSADTPSPGSGNSDLNADSAVTDSADKRALETDLQAAADAVTAILPPGERGRGDVISHISEKVFAERGLEIDERLAILRDLILRDLQVLSTARLTKS